MNVIVASQNQGKIKEIKNHLETIHGCEVFGYEEYYKNKNLVPPTIPDETGETFEENALIKAHAFDDLIRTCEETIFVLSDDSGLCVDALGGEPGIHSRRFSDGIKMLRGETEADANNRKMLDVLKGETNRRAKFVTVMICISNGFSKPIVATGEVMGQIGEEKLGTNGHGYDPIFFPDEFKGMTFAELTMEQKNSISHRGRALEKIKLEITKLNLF